MTKLPRILAIVLVVAGVVMIAVGASTYYLVHRELADEKITVADDADSFAGKDVRGPFTAYSQAITIKRHALDLADGLTYAQLPQDDARRETVMQGSFLRASLFTSVVAFGVAALVAGLGLLFVLVGLALLGLDRRYRGPAALPAPQGAPGPAPVEPPPFEPPGDLAGDRGPPSAVAP